MPFNQAPGPQPVQQLAPEAQTGGSQTLTLDPQTGKLPQGIALQDGRERCFGKHVLTDVMCKECPEWIKSQCIPQTSGAQAAAPDLELAQLQQQLEGQPAS